MDYSSFYRSIIDVIYVEEAISSYPVVRNVREKTPEIPIIAVTDASEIPEDKRNGKSVYLHRQIGAPITRCPGSKGQLCCNYLTVELYSGCPIGCTYCIMRSYLNFSPVSIPVETEPIVTELGRIAEGNPGRMIRAGTGETGDSLLYDPLFGLSRPIIEGVAGYENVFFELKTKTSFVEHLLSSEPKGNSIIGFSVAPQSIIDREEGSAASLADRLRAARKAVNAGFGVSFHFDPIFAVDNWEQLYFPVADALAEFHDENVAWISVGTFRYPPELKDKIAERPYLYDEFVPSGDGKFRYQQRIRRKIYSAMQKRIRSAVNAPVYLCMESSAAWKRGFGALPSEIADVRPLFS